jgi:DNA-binding protein H-NS
MLSRDLKSMSVDELWDLHEKVVAELSRKIVTEKSRLDERLHKLSPASDQMKHKRRPYPKVLPKYRNPTNPAETWAGRGKQPRWLRTQLRSGKVLDDFRIERLAAG